METFSVFIESMKRLYADGKVDERKINLLVANGKITEKERLYILTPSN